MLNLAMELLIFCGLGYLGGDPPFHDTGSATTK